MIDQSESAIAESQAVYVLLWDNRIFTECIKAQNFIINLIIKVTALLSPTETWERKFESVELKVRAETESTQEDTSSGWQLTEKPSQLPI